MDVFFNFLLQIEPTKASLRLLASLSLSPPPPQLLEKTKQKLTLSFVKSFENQPRDADGATPRVQAFFDRADEAFRAHLAWQGATPAVLAAAGEGLEKYVLTKIHAQVFGASALDAERDEALSQRLSALSFVRPEHLEIPASHAGLEETGGGSCGSSTSTSSSAAARALALAQRELSKVNAFKAPRDKLVCILNACRVISDSLSAVASREAAEKRKGKSVGEEVGGAIGAPSSLLPPSSSSPATSDPKQASTSRGADDFLPLLIYVLIRAAPPKLASNLEYIQRFRGSRRFHGESAYFFTQLYAAASFVETVNTSSLNVNPDEFVARMVAAGVPDMQLLPPPPRAAAAAEAAAPAGDDGDDGDGGGRGERGETTASGSASSSSSAAAAAAAPQRPRAEEEASAVRENPAFFLSAAAAGRPSTREALRIPRDLPRHEYPPPPPPQTSEQLEQEGAALVIAADERGELTAKYRFLNSPVGGEDLSIADVSELLSSYKVTVLRFEAIARAVDARARASGEKGEGEGKEEDERGAAAVATGATAAAAPSAAAEGNFFPSPPWAPTSSATAAKAEEGGTAAAAAAPEAELDLSALSLSPPSSLSLSSAAPPRQQQQPSPDVAHILTSSATTTPSAAEVAETTNSGNGRASLI